MYFLI
jgi:Ran GTPase-activating protein (RanGAP) involved in mRNA processing and transport